MTRLIIENPPLITDKFNFRSYNPYSYSGVLDTGGSGASSVSSGGEAPINIGEIIKIGGKVIDAGTKLLDKDKNPIEKPETPKPSEPPTSQITTPAAQPIEQVNTNLPGNPLEPGNNGLLTDPNAGNLPSPGGVLPNVETPPPDNLLNGDSGVLDSEATADPFANANTEGTLGPNDLPSIPNVTSPLHLFDTGTNLSDAAGAVTLPEGATQMADGSMILADGTTIGADGVVTDAAGNVLNGAQANSVINSAFKWGGAAAGAIGFGMSVYDMAKNGVSIENFGGAITGGLAAVSPWIAGAGPAAAVVAIPLAWKAIMGSRHKHPPKFIDDVEDVTPFTEDEDGNIYMKVPGHGEIFRYNPSTDRYQAIRNMRGGNDVGMGDEIIDPTYGGEWVDLEVYEHNGEYYLHPMKSEWSDFYNIKAVSDYAKKDIRPNDVLDGLYNTRMEGFRTKQEADDIWDNRFSQEEGPMGSAVPENFNSNYDLDLFTI